MSAGGEGLVTVVDVPGRVAARHSQLLAGPDDGYGDVSLERVQLEPGDAPCSRTADGRARLVAVLTGYARVSVRGGPDVVLGPDEVVHIGRDRDHVVALLPAGPPASLLVLSTGDAS